MYGVEKRDLVLFGVMFIAPMFGFILTHRLFDLDWNDNLNLIMGGIYCGVTWLGIWAIALIIDRYLKEREERKKETEINDPSLAFGHYLFNKKE